MPISVGEQKDGCGMRIISTYLYCIVASFIASLHHITHPIYHITSPHSRQSSSNRNVNRSIEIAIAAASQSNFAAVKRGIRGIREASSRNSPILHHRCPCIVPPVTGLCFWANCHRRWRQGEGGPKERDEKQETEEKKEKMKGKIKKERKRK